MHNSLRQKWGLLVGVVLLFLVIGVIYLLIHYQSTTHTSLQKTIGGNKDSHGCLVAAGYSWCQAKNECLRPWEQYCTKAAPVKAVFSCSSSKTITATFYPKDDKFVDLVLSDGRKLSIPHASSASGARYAKSGSSFVFWNVGNSATITENGKTTFGNCVSEKK